MGRWLSDIYVLFVEIILLHISVYINSCEDCQRGIAIERPKEV